MRELLRHHGGLTRTASALGMDPQRLLAIRDGGMPCVWEAERLARGSM